MNYITVTELLAYKIGFDLTKYTEVELEQQISIASSLINDYIGYSLGSTTVTDEQGQAVAQIDGKMFVSLKSRNIDVITALKIFTYGNAFISPDLTNLELFNKPGFFYLSGTGINPAGISGGTKYEVSYTLLSQEIPEQIKLATAIIVGNLLRSDYNYSQGINGSNEKVRSFVSGDYSVKMGEGAISYAGAGSIQNPYIDDGVKALLIKFKRTNQNTY